MVDQNVKDVNQRGENGDIVTQEEDELFKLHL